MKSLTAGAENYKGAAAAVVLHVRPPAEAAAETAEA